MVTVTVEILSTPDVARARAERIRRGLRDWLETVQEIALAWERRDWQVLGYPTWDAYVDAEYSGPQLRMPEVHRRQAVTALRLVGMSTRAIGTSLGISHATAARDLASVTAETDVALPAVVTSLDGRTRPATRPAPEPEPSAVAEVVDEPLPGLGEQYEPDPAARIAAVAQVAPEYVRRVDDVAPTHGPAPTDQVWIAVARKGIVGHRPATATSTGCGRWTSNGLTLPAEQARVRHDATWCRTCWPDTPTPTPAPTAAGTSTSPADGAATPDDSAPAAPAAPAADVAPAAPAPASPLPASPAGGAGVTPTLDLGTVARLRAAFAHLQHAGGRRTGPRQYEVPYFSTAPTLAGPQPVTLADVQWWPDGELHVRFVKAGRYCQASTEFYAGSIGQAADLLCAIGLLPAHLSTLYAAGVRDGLRAGDAIDGRLLPGSGTAP